MDTLTGGAGNDQFTFAAADSGTAIGAIDFINSWEVGDTLDFGVAVDATTYFETTAADYATALTSANAQMATGREIVSVQVGTDVVVFVDTDADGDTDTSVALIGQTLASIGDGNFI